MRSVALGHSPKLLSELIHASTSSTSKMKKSPSFSSLYSSPKVLEIYLNALNSISQALNTSGDLTSNLEWPPANSADSVEFLKIIMQSLVVC